MKPTRVVLRALVALLAPLAVLALATTPAAAHGGDGQIEITSIERDGDDITVVARLTYVEDGHGVPDATVNLIVGDDTPVPMEPGPEEGDYTATAPAATADIVRVVSVEPPTNATGRAPAAEETPTTAEGATTTTAGGTNGDGETPTTQAPAETVPEPNGIDEAPDEDGGGGNVVVLLVLVVVIAAAIGAVFLLRRKKPGEV